MAKIFFDYILGKTRVSDAAIVQPQITALDERIALLEQSGGGGGGSCGNCVLTVNGLHGNVTLTGSDIKYDGTESGLSGHNYTLSGAIDTVFSHYSSVSLEVSNLAGRLDTVDYNASEAMTRSDAAYTAATNAQSTADSAYSEAGNAKASAESAYNRAEEAYTKADEAYNEAYSAYSYAESVQNAANNAQSTADTANSLANSAYDLANNAQGAAESAISFGQEATNKAQDALDKADTLTDETVPALDTRVSALEDAEDVTRFQVYPNRDKIMIGETYRDADGSTYTDANGELMIYRTPYFDHDDTSVNADNMEQRIAFRSNVPISRNDIRIDWGDGSSGGIAGYLYENQDKGNGEWTYIVSHTYNSVGHYDVTIRGKDYFAIQMDGEGTNQVCRILDEGYPIASCVTSMTGLCTFAPKLVRINAAKGNRYFTNIHSVNEMFSSCYNLREVKGFSQYVYQYLRTANGMFYHCNNLLTCDFRLPPVMLSPSGYQSVFAECVSLKSDIASLLPQSGFANSKVDLSGMFTNCSSLTGTVPASLLWENKFIDWTAGGFVTGASSSIRSQCPRNWGGTNGYSESLSGEDVTVSIYAEDYLNNNYAIKQTFDLQTALGMLEDRQNSRLKSVNGNFPDASGNVNIETGGGMQYPDYANGYSLGDNGTCTSRTQDGPPIEYTVPADGWIAVNTKGISTNSMSGFFTINNSGGYPIFSGQEQMFLPVKAGDVFALSADIGSTYLVMFYPNRS